MTDKLSKGRKIAEEIYTASVLSSKKAAARDKVTRDAEAVHKAVDATIRGIAASMPEGEVLGLSEATSGALTALANILGEALYSEQVARRRDGDPEPDHARAWRGAATIIQRTAKTMEAQIEEQLGRGGS